MMKRFLVVMIVGVWLGSSGFTLEPASIYSKAVKFAKAGKGDFAYMQYNKLLRKFPESRYRQQALFAAGEYQFRESNHNEARESFEAYVGEFPDAQDRIYALAYLLNLAGRLEDAPRAEQLEGEIIKLQQVSLVFRETKEVAYRSPLYQNYRTVINIDKIEFYVEGELFAKVAF